MKQPTLLNDGEKKVKNFTSVLVWLCISLSVALFIFLVVMCMQHQEIQLLKGKITSDSTAIKSYKDLLLIH